jgi:tetratricopeptide (TPR) repeat protein
LIGSIPLSRSFQFVPLILTQEPHEARFSHGKSPSQLPRSAGAIRSVFLVLLAFGCQAAGQAPMQTSPANADQLLRAGVAAEQRGDNRTAIEDFRHALAIQPKLTEARAGLGAALAATGDFDEAINEDTRALAAAPDKTVVRMNLAMAYYKKGDVEDARQQFETIHAAKPLDVSAAVMLGYVYIRMDREAEVVDLLTPLEPGHESNLDLEYVLAFSLIQTGKDKDGVPRMEKVAQATHKADAYVIAGASHLHRGEMTEARADLEAAIHLNPAIPGLSTMAGQAEYALGNMTAAASFFQTALRADPRDFDANLDLGAIRLKERNYETARPLLELALELRPGVPLARLEMAKLNDATGRYAEAATVLADLVKTEPNYFDAHWELAIAYFGLDRPEDGKRERMIAQQLQARQHQESPDAK